MTLYIDTSLLVPLYTFETCSDDVERWFARQADETMAISNWVLTEFTSAIGLKVRMKKLSVVDAAETEDFFDRQRAEYLLLAFDVRMFDQARLFVGNADAGLRSGDALHLAIAAWHDAELCTRDRRFHRAAITLGVPSQLV